jgi:hypothetical protein
MSIKDSQLAGWFSKSKRTATTSASASSSSSIRATETDAKTFALFTKLIEALSGRIFTFLDCRDHGRLKQSCVQLNGIGKKPSSSAEKIDVRPHNIVPLAVVHNGRFKHVVYEDLDMLSLMYLPLLKDMSSLQHLQLDRWTLFDLVPTDLQQCHSLTISSWACMKSSTECNKTFPHVKSLNIQLANSNPIPIVPWKLQFPNLERLNLKPCEFSACKSLELYQETVDRLTHFPKLTDLSICLTQAACLTLSTSFLCGTLRRLCIHGKQFDVSVFQSFKQLQTFDLHLHSPDQWTLEDLNKLKTVTDLTLHIPTMTSAFPALCRMKWLQSLVIETDRPETSVMTIASIAACDQKPFANLTHLSMNGTIGIGEHWMSFAGSPLKTMEIRNSFVSKQSMELLLKTFGNTLKSIQLHRNNAPLAPLLHAHGIDVQFVCTWFVERVE